MWFIKTAPLLFMVAFTGCSSSMTSVVDISVFPVTTANAKFKQLAGEKKNLLPSSCRLPCSVAIEEDSKYQVSIDAPGYYPAVVQFDGVTVLNQVSITNFDQTNDPRHVPLTIPLITRNMAKNTVAKDKGEDTQPPRALPINTHK